VQLDSSSYIYLKLTELKSMSIREILGFFYAARASNLPASVLIKLNDISSTLGGCLQSIKEFAISIPPFGVMKFLERVSFCISISALGLLKSSAKYSIERSVRLLLVKLICFRVLLSLKPAQNRSMNASVRKQVLISSLLSVWFPAIRNHISSVKYLAKLLFERLSQVTVVFELIASMKSESPL
jgi:hypothetical protein